jgi:hypothetical protein
VTDLRDATAARLARVLERERLDNPWSDRPGTSTRLLYSDADLYTPERLDVHDELVAARLAAAPSAVSDGTLAVVVTAGPPGAGKSTALARYPEFAGFRAIDADDFKDDLLVRAQRDGLLDRWTVETLPDERPIAPRELATYVHAESTVIATAYREAAFDRGENVLVHGTLADPQTIDDLLGAFGDADYERLVIVDVEVPQAVAVERALGRWWTGRTSDDPLGGRFVPPAAIGRYYPDGTDESVTLRNADEFARRAEALDWDVALERLDG